MVEAAGLSTYYENTVNFSLEARQNAISQLLQKRPEAEGTLHPQQLWSTSAWNIIHEISLDLQFQIGPKTWVCRNAYKITDAILNRCITFRPDLCSIEPVSNMQYFVHWNFIKGSEDIPNYFLSYIHTGEQPVVGDEPVLMRDINQVVDITSLYGSVEDRNQCVTQCLDGALVDRMGCSLPWAVGQLHVPLCNMTQFTKILTALWDL